MWDHAVEPPDFHDLLRLVEDCSEAGRDGAPRHGARRRPRAGDGRHYRVARSRRAPGPARGEPRHHSGRRGHAAADSSRRRREGARDVRVGQADRRRGRLPRRARGRSSSTATSCAGAVAFARDAGTARCAPHPRTRDAHRQAGRRRARTRRSSPRPRAGARRRARHQTAPLRPIEAIEAAATLPFDEGCRRERELSLECVRSEQARRMVHGFLAERSGASVPDSTRTRERRPRSSRSRSSARARWAAASRWPAPTPACA